MHKFYQCTNISCSPKWPGQRLTLVSVSQHAMLPMVALLLLILCVQRRCPAFSTFLLCDGFVGNAHVTSVTLPLWLAELIGYHLPNQVTLKLNHVKKSIVVPFPYLDNLVKTYRLLGSGEVPGACHVDKLEVRCRGGWGLTPPPLKQAGVPQPPPPPF